MEWKLTLQGDKNSTQAIRLRETLTFGDRIASKQGVAETWQLSEEILTGISAWSAFVRKIKEDSPFFDNALREPFQTFVRFSAIDGALPSVVPGAGVSHDSSLNSLETIDTGGSLEKVTGKPHWRLVFPDLSACIAHDEDAKWAIRRLRTDVEQILANRQQVSEAAVTWNAAIAELSGWRLQIRAEIEFWNSIFNSPTALQRWFRSYSVADEPLELESESEGGVAVASTQRLDRFAQILEKSRSAFSVLMQKPQDAYPSYLECLSLAPPDEALNGLAELEEQKAIAAVQVHLLYCDWNAAVEALEELQTKHPFKSSGAEHHFIAVVGALQVIGDFANLNMLLDCCGDRITTGEGVEGLREHVDKVSRLLEAVEDANTKRFGLITRSSLTFLTNLGVDNAAVSLQRWRHKVLRVTAFAALAILFLGLTGYGLFVTRHYGKAKIKFAFEPRTSASTLDVILLPRFLPEERARSTASVKAAIPASSATKPNEGTAEKPQADSASDDNRKKLPSSATDGDRMRQILKSVLADIDRQIERIETKYEAQTDGLQKELRQSKDASEKEIADKRDEIQDQFAKERQEKIQSLASSAEKTFTPLKSLLSEMTRNLVSYAQQQVPQQQRIVAANALYRNYFPGWRIVAKIGNQEAYSGASVFDPVPEPPINGIWSADHIARCTKYAQDQLAKLDNLTITFAANGANVEPQYKASVLVREIPTVSVNYENVKKLTADLSNIQQQVVRLDDDSRLAVKEKFQALEKEAGQKRQPKEAATRAKLATLEEEKNKAIASLEKRKDVLNQKGTKTAELNSAEAKARCILFDEIWKGGKVLKAVVSGKNNRVNFGMQAEGDYQILVKALDAEKVQIYRSDWHLPSVSTSVWTFLFSQNVTVFEDAEIDSKAFEEFQ